MNSDTVITLRLLLTPGMGEHKLKIRRKGGRELLLDYIPNARLTIFTATPQTLSMYHRKSLVIVGTKLRGSEVTYIISDGR